MKQLISVAAAVTLAGCEYKPPDMSTTAEGPMMANVEVQGWAAGRRSVPCNDGLDFW